MRTPDSRLSLTLICKDCGLEWTPRFNPNHLHQVDGETQFRIYGFVDAEQTRCPACNALELAMEQYRKTRRIRDY